MSASAEPRVQVPDEFAQALAQLGLAGSEPLVGAPLAGGVSSDIWRIDTERGPVCAKRALPKLRVAADWRAPIARNLYEARWLRVARSGSPAWCSSGACAARAAPGSAAAAGDCRAGWATRVARCAA